MSHTIKLSKALFYLFLLAGFYQCTREADTGNRNSDTSTAGPTPEEIEVARDAVLPTSAGTEFSFLLVMDSELNTSEFRESLYKTLYDPYPGLVSEESSFKPTFIISEEFAGLHQRQANIIFVSSKPNDPVMTKMLEVFTMEEIAGAMKNKEVLEKEDIWARPQQVFYLPCQGKEDIISLLTRNKQELLASLDRNERARVYSIIYPKLGENDMTDRIRQALNIQLKIPSIYRLAKDATNQKESEKLHRAGVKSFFWFRNDTRNIANNILVYTQDYKGPEQLTQDYILKLRDKVGEAFVPGPTDSSYMKTEPIVHPDMSRTTLNGLSTIINRGHWRVEGDFMGGPFTNFTILDDANKRVITLDGFIYAPDQGKLPFIKRLEIIFSTLKVE